MKLYKKLEGGMLKICLNEDSKCVSSSKGKNLVLIWEELGYFLTLMSAENFHSNKTSQSMFLKKKQSNCT